MLVDTYRLQQDVAREESNFTGTYQVDFRFAAAPWHNGFETGHRPLVEVLLSGTHSVAGQADQV